MGEDSDSESLWQCRDAENKNSLSEFLESILGALDIPRDRCIITTLTEIHPLIKRRHKKDGISYTNKGFLPTIDMVI